MKVQRKKPKVLKSYFIKRRENLDQNDFNIHIFEDNGQKENKYVFVITKDDGEKIFVEKENIVSMIYLNSQDDTKFVVNQLGKAIKEIRNLNRNIYDLDLINSIKEHITNLDYDLWTNPTASKYVSKEEFLAKKNHTRNRMNNMTSEDKEINSIKPIVLLETLEKMGIINIHGTEPNGDESKIKFEFIDHQHGNSKFNISVAKHSGLGGFKANLFNDFSNTKNKALGGGSLGLIGHLGENGLFKDFNKMADEDKKIFSKEYLINNILPNVSENDKVFSNYNYQNLQFDKKAVTFQPILRNTEYSNKMLNTMIEFLEFRGIKGNVIDKLLEDDSLFVGDFYNSKIVEELDDNGKIKPNYSFNNVPYFRLRTGYGNKFSGAERFKVVKQNNNQKPFSYDKQNIGAVDGRYFSFGEQAKPKKAIVHEAIIDSISSYCLLSETNENPDLYRYISTQGASHMKKFFSKNVGFWVTKNSKTDKYETNAIYINKNDKEMSVDLMNKYKEKFKDKELIFCDYGNLTKSIEYKLKDLEEIFGTVVIKKYNERTDVDFSTFDKNKTILIDDENFYDFLDSIKLKFDYDKDKRKNILKSFYIKENSVSLDDKKKSAIRNKIIKFFGTDDIAFCLDNDHAGLKYLPVFTEMERHFGIKASYMIPDDLQYEMFSGLTLKDFLSDYKDLVNNDEYDKAYLLLEKYISQKPEVDNNDVLKKYLSLKDKEPEKAKEILDYKLEQLNLKTNDLKKKNNNKQRP